MLNKIGAHLSIAKSIADIFNQAEELDIKYIQCFTASNIRFSFKAEFEPRDLKNFLKEVDRYHVYSHASYLMNLASDSEDLRKKSELLLLAELKRCKILSIGHTTIHPGSLKNREDGLRRISESIIKVINKFNDDSVKILIESSAGVGNTLPVSIEEMHTLWILLKDVYKNVGFTIDTCHVHASGIDLSNEEMQKKFFDEFDEKIGIQNINLIHLNDSRKPSGSCLDRHENIGQGTIGQDGFSYLLKNFKLKDIPKILETPYNDFSDYKNDLNFLKKLL